MGKKSGGYCLSSTRPPWKPRRRLHRWWHRTTARYASGRGV